MASTSTLGDIIEQLVEETGIGFVIPSYTGTTTTLTLTNSYLQGPFSGGKFPIGAPIIVTSSTGLGDTTYVKGYVPSTGVITVSPAITTGSTDAVVLYPDTDIDHPDRLKEAINRAITNRIFRWQPVPLTYAADGDMLASGTSSWTTSDVSHAPLTKLATAFPEILTSQALVATGDASAGTDWTVTSANIDVPLNSTVTGYQWYCQTALAVASGSGTATLTVRDVTNSADIKTYIIAGSATQTLATTSTKPLNMEFTFNVPATCKQIAFRVTVSAASTTLHWYPLIAFPLNALTYPIPNRVISDTYIGNFHYSLVRSGTDAPYSREFTEPITTNGFTHRIHNVGDHFEVTFNFRPQRPVYYDEAFSESALSLLTSTTTFPLNQVVKWAKYELFKYLYTREKPDYRTTSYGSVIPIPSRWKTRAIEAQKEAQGSDYEPEMLQVYGRT